MTPESMGFALTIDDGPTITVPPFADNRHSVGYRCTLTRNGKPVWSGPYFLGWGHIKKEHITRAMRQNGMDPADNAARHILRDGVDAQWYDPAKMVPAARAILQRAAMLQGLKPTLSDVMHSLLLDGSAFFDGYTFAQWANECGYSDDSIRARDTFTACDEIGRLIAGHTTADELAQLREWASNQ